MNFVDVRRNFAARTIHNLGIVEEAATASPREHRFEVTQLINSLLGLVVLHSKQVELNKISATPLSLLVSQGWLIPPGIVGHAKTPNLRELVGYMRNAVAHFHLSFLADDTGEISGLTMWNLTRNSTKDWEISLRIVELRDFVLRLNNEIQRGA